MRNVMKPTG